MFIEFYQNINIFTVEKSIFISWMYLFFVSFRFTFMINLQFILLLAYVTLFNWNFSCPFAPHPWLYILCSYLKLCSEILYCKVVSSNRNNYEGTIHLYIFQQINCKHVFDISLWIIIIKPVASISVNIY